jgi:hypothetical protein
MQGMSVVEEEVEVQKRNIYNVSSNVPATI